METEEVYYDSCFPAGRPKICKTCYYELACAECGDPEEITPIPNKPFPCTEKESVLKTLYRSSILAKSRLERTKEI